jgi:predicted dienelactone hydrolase
MHLPLTSPSHGTCGSPLNNRVTALALAKAGFVGAGPPQSRDNYTDRSCALTQRQLAERPHQISRVHDDLLGMVVAVFPGPGRPAG